LGGYAPRRQVDPAGLSASRRPARHQSRRLLLSGQRLPFVPPGPSRLLGAVWLLAARVLPHDQSRAPAPHAARAGCLRAADEAARQCYVQRINRRLERTGTLWEGRFRSCLVASDNYVLACYRYIELNPVRAGMVTHPEKYRWSSYSANASDLDDRHLSAHPAYQALASDSVERRRAYRVLCEQAPPASDLEDIRKATRIGCTVGKPRRRRGRPFLLDEKNGVCPHLS